MSRLEDQYQQNVQAFKDMEMEIPVDLETVKTKLSKHQKAAMSAGNGQLVISPAVTKDFTFYDLITLFNKKQKTKTWVWRDLWDQYDVTEPASINVISTKSDSRDAFVQHTNKTLETQREVKGEFLSPVEAVVLAAILRLNDKFLAPSTFICFPQLPTKEVRGDSCVGDVFSSGGQLGFVGSGGVGYWSGGVGVSVGKRILISSTSILSAPFSLDGLDELTAIKFLKDEGYTITKEF